MLTISPQIDVEFYQPSLFGFNLGNHGHRRYVVGDFIEYMTAKILRGKRHKCAGNYDYCPDVSVCGKYIECKAMGKSNQTLIYQGRLEKDRAFVNQGNDLYYAIWSHNSNTLNFNIVEDLQFNILINIEWMALVPFYDIEQYCLWKKPERLNSINYGSPENPLYGSGYRIPKSFVEKWIFFEWEIN